jgi:hypothetical protein
MNITKRDDQHDGSLQKAAAAGLLKPSESTLPFLGKILR